MLQYPYQIRADAITAVGAPNSVAYLVKAIYWLYLVARTYYKEALPGTIIEEIASMVESEEERKTVTERSVIVDGADSAEI